MFSSINELVELNKDCPKNKIGIAIRCTEDNLNGLTLDEYKEFCIKEKSVILNLLTSLVIKEIYHFDNLPDVEKIKEISSTQYKKVE
jgi:hypothetical protein